MELLKSLFSNIVGWLCNKENWSPVEVYKNLTTLYENRSKTRWGTGCI